MKKFTALLLAVFTALFCCSSCSKPEQNNSDETPADVSADAELTEESTEPQEEEETTAETEEPTTTEEKTTAAQTTEEPTEPRENAAPFGDFSDVGYLGDAVNSNGNETYLLSTGSNTFSFNYGKELNRDKRIRLAEFFNRCVWTETAVSGTSGDVPPWLQNDNNIQFMVKKDNELRFISFRSNTSSLTYIRSAYEEEEGAGNTTTLKCVSPEIHIYGIDFEYMKSNIESIIGSNLVISANNFSILDDSDLYFNFSPYYHPENMTLYPENADDPFGAFNIPNYGAFQVEKNTSEVKNILNRRTYTKITNAAEIPAQSKGSDIEKCYKLGGNPQVTPHNDRTYDQVIIMCRSSNGYYVINIVSGKDAVLSCAKYQFRTDGDRKICTNMDEVKSGHNIEWYRCSGDLAAEIRHAVDPNAD